MNKVEELLRQILSEQKIQTSLLMSLSQKTSLSPANKNADVQVRGPEFIQYGINNGIKAEIASRRAKANEQFESKKVELERKLKEALSGNQGFSE